MRTRGPSLILSLVLTSGCSAPPDPSIGRASAALTVGAEVTLLPDLPGSTAPIDALGSAATAAIGAQRATAWLSRVGGTSSVSAAFWSRAGGLRSTVSLGASNSNSPLVATDGTLFLVVWDSPSGLVAVRFDASGERLDATPLVVSTVRRVVGNNSLAALYDGRDFVLAYPRDVDGVVEVTRVTPAGAVRDRATVPLVGAAGASRVRIARAGSGYLVASTGTYSSSFAYQQLSYVRLGADLALLDASARTIASTPRQRGLEDVATDGTDYLLLWSDEATPTAGAPRLLAARVSASTGAVGPAVDVGPGAPTGDARAWVERVPGGYLVARPDRTAGTFTTRQLRDTGGLVEAAPVARAVGAGLTGLVARTRSGAEVELTWAATGGPVLATATLAADGAVTSPESRPLAIPGGTNAGSVGLAWDGTHFVAAWREGEASWAKRLTRAGASVEARGVSIPPGEGSSLAATPGRIMYARTVPNPMPLTGALPTYVFHTRRSDLTGAGTDVTLFPRERPTETLIAGGPPGYLAATGIVRLDGLSTVLRFAQPDGTVVRSVTLFTGRTDGPTYAFAASRTLWTVAWFSRRTNSGVDTCSVEVALYTPAGEFAAVPFSAPTQCAERGGSPLAVASDGTDFLVAWSLGAASSPVLGLRVRSDGTRADAAPLTVSPTGGALRAVWDGRGYTVAWAADGAQPISAARVGTDGRVLTTTTALVPDVRAGEDSLFSGPDFALATDGTGTLALAYRRPSAGGVTRAQVRLFDWETMAVDGGVDGGVADAGPRDAAVVTPADVVALDVTPADVGALDVTPADAGASDVAPADVAPADVGAVADVAVVVDSGADAGVRDASAPDVLALEDASLPPADAPGPPGEDDGGCSVAGAPRGAAGGAPMLSLLAACAGVLRRRRAVRRRR